MNVKVPVTPRLDRYLFACLFLIIIGLGIIIAMFGAVIVGSYANVGKKANIAYENTYNLEKANGTFFPQTGAYVAEMKVYKNFAKSVAILLILNLFITGAAITMSGYAISKMKEEK